MTQQGSSLQQRALRRKALAADGHVGTAQIVKEGHMTGRSIAERFRKGDGVGSRPAICSGALIESHGEFDAAQSGGKENGDAGTIHQIQVDARIAQGQ